MHQLVNRHQLSDYASKFLFMVCLNNIDKAIASAQEVAAINPTPENKALVNELEDFRTLNQAYYSGMFLKVTQVKCKA